MDVFDFDRRVINQNTDGEREAAQSHDVHRLPQRGENDDRTQDRQWNRSGDHNCAAPIAEKKQDHQRGQAGGNHPFAQNAVDRCADENRLVKKLRKLEFLRQCRLNLRE